MRQLAVFNPYWIEEPLSPDDILGHQTLQRAMDAFPKGEGSGHWLCGSMDRGEKNRSRIHRGSII